MHDVLWAFQCRRIEGTWLMTSLRTSASPIGVPTMHGSESS